MRQRRTSDAPNAVAAVSACVMLIPREIFEAIGLFDEDYFFSFEDLDFCLRAKAAGFDAIVETTATAFHEGGRSIGAGSPTGCTMPHAITCCSRIV